MRGFFTFIILTLLIASCSKAPVREKRELSSAEPPTIKYIVTGDSAVCVAQVFFQSPNETLELIRDFQSAEFRALNLEGDEIITLKPDTLGKSIWKVSAETERGSIILFSKFKIDPDLKEAFRCQLTVESSKYIWKRETQISGLNKSYNFNGPDPAVILFSYPEVTREKIYLKGVAVRNFTAEEEYLPSSESVRGEIWNERGAQVFNSGKNKSFLMVIKKVEPETPGDYKQYSVEYSSDKVAKPLLSSGKYKARLTIPAKPFQYYSQMEFYLEGR